MSFDPLPLNPSFWLRVLVTHYQLRTKEISAIFSLDIG